MQRISLGSITSLANIAAIITIAAFSSQGESSDFKYEAASGSFWYSSGDESEELIEWKSDNTLTTHRAPFSNLSYPEIEIPFADNGRILTKNHGNFTIWYKYRTFFRRENGLMIREDFFDHNHNLGCVDGPEGKCMVYPINIPNLGAGLAVFRPDFSLNFWIEDHGSYRAASALELAIFTNDAEQSWISPDSTYGVLVRSDELNHTIVLKTVGEEYTHDIETAIPDTYNDMQLLSLGNEHFLYVGYSNNRGSSSSGKKRVNESQLRLYAIDINGTEISSRLLLEKSQSGNSLPSLMAFSSTDLTVAWGNMIVNYPLNGSAGETLFTCLQYIQQNELSVTSQGLVRTAICGKKFLAVRPGVIAQQIEFSFNLADADYVDDYSDDRLVMAASTNKQVELVFPNGQRRQLQYGSTNPDPQLLQSWTENGVVCGTSVTAPANSYLCKNFSGEWIARSSIAGEITDVTRLNGQWWAVSTAEELASVYQLQPSEDGSEHWQLIDSVPMIAEKDPKFVVSAGQLTALDTGGDFTYLLEGGRFALRYPRARPAAAFDFFNPVIDSEGRLYDFSAIDVYLGTVSFYLPDGSAVNTDYQAYIFSTNNQALKRGVLLQENTVFRAEKHIYLPDLYGEFSRAHSSFSLENNAMAYYFLGSQTTSGYPELYIYDGIHFEQIANESHRTKKTPLKKRPLLPKSLTKPDNPGKAVSTSRQTIFKDKLGMWVSVGGGDTMRSGATLEELFTNRESQNMNADNFFVDAMIAGDGLLTVNRKGVWHCPASVFTPVDEQTFDIPVSVGCKLQRADYGIRKMARLAGRFVLLQGQTLMLLNQLDDLHPGVLSQSQTVNTFSIKGNILYWTEPGKLFAYDAASGTTSVQTSALDLEGAIYGAGWVCSKQGLYWSDGVTTGQILGRCEFLDLSSNSASVVSGKRLYRCTTGQCDSGVLLPLPWRSDSSLGEFSNDQTTMTLAGFASQLYKLAPDATELEPLPLRIGGGKNLIFAPISRITEDFILTKGGGLIRLATDGHRISASLLRLE